MLVMTAAKALNSSRLVTRASDAAQIYKLANDVVDQIYFASGAFGTAETNHQSVPAEDGFAAEAFPILDHLTGFKHPTITHRIIGTLAHLSSSDPRRAFLLVERSISAGDAYTYDPRRPPQRIAQIQAAESRASAARRGLWGHCEVTQ